MFGAPVFGQGVFGQAFGAVATTPSMAVATGGILVTGETGHTVTVQGTATSWVSGVTTFALSGGTGASITVTAINNATQVATLTIIAGSAAATLTITDSLDAASTTLTVDALATGYSLSGPSTGLVGNASTAFTVTLTPGGSAFASAVVITGAISPDGTVSGTVTLAAYTASATGTFTVTPSVAGAHTVSTTNGSGLTDPGSLGYSATSSPGVAGDSNIIASTNAFKVTVGVAWETALYCSNQMFFGWVAGSSDTLSVHVDTTALDAGGVTGACPTLLWSVGVGSSALKGSIALVSGTIISGHVRRIDMITAGTAIPAGTYPVAITINSGSGTDGIDSWTTPVDLIRILAFTHHDDSTIVTAAYPYLRSKKALIFGDSEAQGRNTWVDFVSRALDAFPAYVCKDGDGLVSNTNCTASNWPPYFGIGASNQAYQWHWSGQSRLTAGLFNEQPDYILWMLGSNDGGHSAAFGTAIGGFCAALRTGAPSAWILVVPMLNRSTPYSITDVYPQFATAFASIADSKTKLLDVGALTSSEMLLGMSSGAPSSPLATFRASDGEHPWTAAAIAANGNEQWNTTAEIASQVIRLIGTYINPSVRRVGLSGGMNG